MSVAMAEMGIRDAHGLRLREHDLEFRKLQDFLKGLEITLPTAAGQRRSKKIRGLFANAAEYVFSTEEGLKMTVKVRSSFFHCSR